MRLAAASMVCSFVLFGCPGTEGAAGPQGTPGAQGPVGPQGPKGDPGAIGMTGPMGSTGSDGMTGAQGATGPAGAQGLQGPAGMVLVLDGGVVTGPPGSSVLVTPIAAGGATCPQGGIRVTQLSDGGLTNVCNGAQGSTGMTGAQGPMGATGASLSATTLASMSPQCAAGGVLVGLADGGSLAICNGATGTQGMTGMTGTTGSQGPMGNPGSAGAQGPSGPPGPPGPALYLDGGLAFVNDAPTFAGYTALTSNGNLGGHIGANAKCNMEFPGASLCTVSDYDRSNPTTLPPASGSWIDSDRGAGGTRTQNSCSAGGTSWLNGANDTGTALNPQGTYSGQVNCTQVKPIACCRVPTNVVFRGFTTMTWNGSLGGHVGANAKCVAEFPGSFFCTVPDFDRANVTVTPPASGAWIDSARSASGSRTQNSCSVGGTSWTNGANDTGTALNPQGTYSGQVNCTQVKPLTCCNYR